MKTVFRIFGIIAVLISLAMCAMSVYRTGEDKKDLKENETQIVNAKAQLETLKEQTKIMTGESKVQMDAQVAAAQKQIDTMPSQTTYTIVQGLLSAMLLLALIFAVFLFRPNLKLTGQLLGAAVLLLLLAYFLSPDIKRGEYSGMASRTLALVSGIPVIISGLFAYGVAKKNTPKVAMA